MEIEFHHYESPGMSTFILNKNDAEDLPNSSRLYNDFIYNKSFHTGASRHFIFP